MFKKSLIAASLLFAGNATAAIDVTNTQMKEFGGAAGNTTSEVGVDPFIFNKFDETLGTLLNVFFKASFQISGGLIGADNMTNSEVSGTGLLGAKLSLTGSEPLLNDSYTALFQPLSLVQSTTFNLAADPTLSTGGTGPDIQQFNGTTLDQQTNWLASNTNFLSYYTGSGQTFSIDFDTDSTVVINASGAQGFFQVPNVYLKVEMYYEYETAPLSVESPPTDVNAPAGLAVFGASMLFFGAARRRQKNNA